MLNDKHILVGVSGGIAAYKAAELVRALKKRGAEVRVSMTRAATRFITPLTMETLSGHEVALELFPCHRKGGTHHISLAEWADCMVIAPATANLIGKVASGIADDLLSTVLMAARGAVLFAPAMDDRMWANPIVQTNVESLKALGYRFVEPETGELASGRVGRGRLAGVESILEAIEEVFVGSESGNRGAGEHGGTVSSELLRSDTLSKRQIVVTAGRTEEDLDPVRFLTNRSTGKMGYAIAEVARRRGAHVTLISGPTSLLPPPGVHRIPIRTVEELREVVLRHFETCDALIMTAAVLDFRPKHRWNQKLKKDTMAPVLELEYTPDILAELGAQKGHRILVGFAVETEHEVEHAREKLRRKHLDLIAVNNPLVEGAGFGVDTNVVHLIARDGTVESLPKMSKLDVAERVMDQVTALVECEDSVRRAP